VIHRHQVLILIPAYNEEKNLPKVIDALRHDGWDIHVVDDGSSDKTVDVLRAMNVSHHAVEKNRGKGAAIRHGFAWFLKQSHEICVVMDADGQHLAEEVKRFVDAFEKEEADVVLGNRMFNPKGMPLVRVWTNRVMSFLLSFVAGKKMHDTQCGFRAYHRRAIEAISFESDRFEAESEILLSAAKNELKITHVPISTIYRDETSHIHPVRDTIRFLRFLFKHLLK
jgi:glycosyltransferase involved in cell wall biosynthesis